MLELGSIPHIGYGAHATKPTNNGSLDLTRPKAPDKIADDDAAVAVIRNSVRAEIANIQQDGLYPDAEPSPTQRTKDAAEGIRQKMAKLGELAEELASGRYSARHISESMETQVEAMSHAPQEPAHPVYSDPGALVEKIREAIKAINAFDELEPERVLDLLKDARRQNTAERTG